MNIITDGKKKAFLYRNEVPKAIIESEFDWLSEEEGDDYFLKYRGNYYHLSQFMVVPKSESTDLNKWDGYLSETFFSGVVIKCPKFQPETYIIGRFWQ